MSFIDYVQRRINGKIVIYKPQNETTTAYILNGEIRKQLYYVSAVVTAKDGVEITALLQVKDLQINRIVFDDRGTCKDILVHFEEWLNGGSNYVCKSDERRSYATTGVS